MTARFHAHDISARLTERKRLKSFLNDLFELEQAVVQQVDYIFCADKYLLGINQRFLDHNDLTDIITFTLSAPGAPVVGEIYISIERARENATLFNQSFSRELHRLIFHGALHLCGYNDKQPREKRKMTALENKYLRLYFE